MVGDYQTTIKKILARQVLDSRGNPTVEVEIITQNNIRGKAIVPSGASTGIHEALELRDNEKAYLGQGVMKAIYNVKMLSKLLKGWNIFDQEGLDTFMKSVDGTPNKSDLGANCILGISMAASRTAAKELKIPYYQYLAKLAKTKKSDICLPIPFANVINGGKHAPGKLKAQEFMIVPVKARTFSEATMMISETYHLLREIIKKKFKSVGVGDEGGFAPPLSKPEEALDLITQAIKKAGYEKKVMIALDPASSEFYNKKTKKYDLGFKKMSYKELSNYWNKLLKKYSIISLEDVFSEDDFEAWHYFKKNSKIQLVGDDLLVTNPERIKLAIEKKLCNSLLLKVNQIGTLTEAIESARMVMKKGWTVMVSHRSGETEDTLIADLAVALGCGQIKIGAPCRGERTAKYNRLLRIEEELGEKSSLKKFKIIK